MNNPHSTSCGCDVPEMHCLHKDKKSLAMAYVPWQTWQDVMDGCTALKHGTIFEELVLPFEGTKAACSSFAQENRGNCHNNYYNRRGIR